MVATDGAIRTSYQPISHPSRGVVVARTSRYRQGHRPITIVQASLTFGALLIAAIAWSWVLTVPGLWLPIALAGVVATFLLLVGRGYFRSRMVPDSTSRLPLVAVAVSSSAVPVLVADVAVMESSLSGVHLLALLCAQGVAVLAAQKLGLIVARWQWRAGRMRSQALVYGSDELAWELAVEIRLRPEYGVDVAGFIAREGEDSGRLFPSMVFPETTPFEHVIEMSGADRLIVGPTSGTDERDVILAARRAGARGMAVFVVPRLYQMGLGMDSKLPDRARGYPLVRLQRSSHPVLSLQLKRVFDVVAATTVLFVASPLLLFLAAMVKLTSPGPALFTQDRVGQFGRVIKVHKLRSMTMSGSSDTEWTADSRVTKLGALLRRSNLDELPQLWSVVVGDMSLVGPRPERPAFVDRFAAEIPEYSARHRMPVGITGLAQIAGLRGDTSIAERIKYDNLYIDQWSFSTDLRILARTALAILRQESASDREVELEDALVSESACPQITTRAA